MISYKPLFRTMLEKNIKLTDLNSFLAPNITSKFNKSAHVNTSTLEKICLYLNCKIQDVIEIMPDDPEPTDKDQPGKK